MVQFRLGAVMPERVQEVSSEKEGEPPPRQEKSSDWRDRIISWIGISARSTNYCLYSCNLRKTGLPGH
jgi:hypothetical protein